MAWVNYQTHYCVWDVITHPYHIFNGVLAQHILLLTQIFIINYAFSYDVGFQLRRAGFVAVSISQIWCNRCCAEIQCCASGVTTIFQWGADDWIGALTFIAAYYREEIPEWGYCMNFDGAFCVEMFVISLNMTPIFHYLSTYRIPWKIF